tara:strand:- start:327 stop:563 length:237 start_codon:yes stop_codon:yes gene_type:complete
VNELDGKVVDISKRKLILSNLSVNQKAYTSYFKSYISSDEYEKNKTSSKIIFENIFKKHEIILISINYKKIYLVLTKK